jgi:hypothetical protein
MAGQHRRPADYSMGQRVGLSARMVWSLAIVITLVVIMLMALYQTVLAAQTEGPKIHVPSPTCMISQPSGDTNPGDYTCQAPAPVYTAPAVPVPTEDGWGEPQQPNPPH